jgi:DNA-binding NtrC family response regulator
LTRAAFRGPVLVVDDDAAFRGVLCAELARRGFVVHEASTGAEAVAGALRESPAVILLDLRLPDADGLDVLERLRAAEVPAGVIVLTGHGAIDTAIRAIRLGAFDYIVKPCPIETVEFAIQKALDHQHLVARQRMLQDALTPPSVRNAFVGAGPAFRGLCSAIGRIARTDAATLVTGETGTGKEMVAALLHAQSPRCDAPFVVVDCATLDEDLLRSELFGHERGAFTGAARQKHGLFEVASGGTLFLDEVGETSPEIQAKLLRVIETGRFRRLGGNAEISVDLRIVSATNRDLHAAIGRGRFREDLYFRLATLVVEVPPLRQRREDIPLLVEHYTTRLNRRHSTNATFSPAAVEELSQREWRGNVRELIHVMEQTLVLARSDVIGVEDLPVDRPFGAADPGGAQASGAGVAVSLQEIQRIHTLAVLEKAGGNRAETARILGVSERHLYRLLRKYGR